MILRTVDRGEWSEPLRWGVVLERPGRKPELRAAFRSSNEADAYVIQRGRAERRVAGVRA